MRVAEIGPADAGVGAARVVGGVVVLDVGVDVPSEDRRGHRLVRLQQLPDRHSCAGDRLVEPGHGRVTLVLLLVVDEPHDRRGGVLPLDPVAPRGEAEAIQLLPLALPARAANQILVDLPQAVDPALPALVPRAPWVAQRECDRGVLARRRRVRVREQRPELHVRRRRGERDGGVAVRCVAGASDVRVWGLLGVPPHRAHKSGGGLGVRAGVERAREREDVDIVLGRAVVVRVGRAARGESAHLVVGARDVVPEGLEDVPRDAGIAGLAGLRREVREGEPDPRIVARVDGAVGNAHPLVVARLRGRVGVRGGEELEAALVVVQKVQEGL
mmetsp:Transcript_19646/g.63053  ORF Transcript_19646/g.63053 Transcript_19646/m.63053 type:complete len:329 (-) Transcript_19646:578-1564(-)